MTKAEKLVEEIAEMNAQIEHLEAERAEKLIQLEEPLIRNAG